jgi:hypothetical protein
MNELFNIIIIINVIILLPFEWTNSRVVWFNWVGRLVTIGTSGSNKVSPNLCVCVCVCLCVYSGTFLNRLILMLNWSVRLVRECQLCWPNQRGWYPGRYPPGITRGGGKAFKFFAGAFQCTKFYFLFFLNFF